MSANPLVSRVEDFIRGSRSDSFDALAVAIFKDQARRCPLWANLAAHRGVAPDQLTVASQIPPMPVGVFRQAEVTVAPGGSTLPGGVCFHSSGTTGTETSKHHLDPESRRVYDVSLRQGYRLAMGPDRAALPVVALGRPPCDAPHSSLSHMMGCLVDDTGGAFYDVEPEGRSLATLKKCLESRTTPLVVFGTAFAWVHVFDDDPDWKARLPDGSVVVETGGFKGRSREVPREQLYSWFRERLGVPDPHCVSEYGMCELTSQYWGFGVASRKEPPPWLQAYARDPFTGAVLPADVPGVLCHVDLANVHTAVAVRTGDWGSVDSAGRVHLHGRAPGAPIRGCSLAAEKWGEFPQTAG
jgi:hypothetical protein